MLVLGGPGSGKTTVSILKAGQIVKKGLKSGQRVLFLSFARATVSRVLEAIDDDDEISPDVKRHIEVDTYHAFFWRLIRTHGYLLGLPRRLDILTPPREAVVLSAIRREYISADKLSDQDEQEKRRREHAERCRAAYAGLVCFDLFAEFAGHLLHGSRKLRCLVSNAYPAIILDEFQDTAPDQWHAIKALGRGSQLLALADPEQRIYDFIGADPERLQHFEDEFAPSKVDLGGESHRSKGTDISQFGFDILKGTFTRASYDGVKVDVFDPSWRQAFTKLVTETLKARERLVEGCRRDWSLAILVPTKRMTRLVSSALREPPGKLPSVEHTATVDMEATILAAEIVAYMLQSHAGQNDVAGFVDLIVSYFLGRRGDSPSKSSLEEAARIHAAHINAVEGRASAKVVRSNSVYLPIEATYEASRDLVLTGDPDRDWTTLRSHLDASSCKRLKVIAAELHNLRLLDRGTQLREALSQNWRDTGRYADALAIVRQALAREHFSTDARPETGVVVMNMHKAKGKQFDEVIIFEGWPRIVQGTIVANFDRIVRDNRRQSIDSQSRQNLRVSVSRSKRRTTVLTPRVDPCVLLVSGAGVTASSTR